MLIWPRAQHRRIGFGKRPALLLIDLYRWVFGDRPGPLLEAIKTWPGSRGRGAEATSTPNVAEGRPGDRDPHRAHDWSRPARNEGMDGVA